MASLYGFAVVECIVACYIAPSTVMQVKNYVFRIIKILGHFPKLLDHRFEVLSTRVTSPGAHLKQVIAGGFKVDIARLYGCRG